MKAKTVLVLFFTFSVLFFSCKNDESEYEKQVKEDDKKIENYLTENSIVAQKDEKGYQYEIVEANTLGEAVSENDVIEFYYSMKLLDGTVIGNYMEESKSPLVFKLTYNAIWPSGLYYCISQMHVGERYRFYLPSYLGYYSYTHADFFQAFSNFIIDIKIASIKTETEINYNQRQTIQEYVDENNYENAEEQSSGLYYIETEEGSGAFPTATDVVDVKYGVKYLDGTVIKTVNSTAVSIDLENSGIIQGFKEGVLKMKKGGKAIFVMPSKIAFNESTCILPLELREGMYEDGTISNNVEPYMPIVYEIELVEIR